MIKITDNLSRVLKEAIDFDIEKAMNLVGVQSVQIISDRVDKGIDVDGRKFKEYSKATKKFKVKTKRDPNFPNLQQTGEMMNNLSFEAKGNTTIVSFSDRVHRKSDETISDIAEQNNKSREFMNHSKQELDLIWNENVIEPFKELSK